MLGGIKLKKKKQTMNLQIVKEKTKQTEKKPTKNPKQTSITNHHQQQQLNTHKTQTKSFLIYAVANVLHFF